jgi:DtxR family Mn-dependent transcriptional regulator
MHAAAIEQFLKTISKLQKRGPNGASVAEIARAAKVSPEQAGQSVQTLIERGLVRMEADDAVRLTAYGLRRLLTESIEDYLVTIYRLGHQQDGERVTTSAIAQALGVSAPSVTSMTQKKLSNLGLVDYQRHHGVTLTPLGERIALQILRHHRIVELFLAETLGLPWDQVHDEANRLEHAMSPMLVERLAAVLGDPQVDPHGDPIPRQDGTIEHRGLSPLYDTPLGQTVTVRRIRDQSSQVLRYLGEIGLVPGISVEVLARSPLKGPLTVRIGENQQVIGRDLAHVILVAQPQPEA